LEAATAALGLAAMIYAVSEEPYNGCVSPTTICTAASGTVLLGVFVTVERRAAEPLAPLPILGRRGVAVTEIETYL
jgi:hypothetical protein